MFIRENIQLSYVMNKQFDLENETHIGFLKRYLFHP